MMSNNSAHTLSGYRHLLMLTRENYMKWQTTLKAYLTPYNHVCVLMRMTTLTATGGTGGVIVDPMPPTDPTELASWHQSEQIAMGVVAGTSYELHLELVHKHEGGSVWDLWKAIEALHVQKDASLLRRWGCLCRNQRSSRLILFATSARHRRCEILNMTSWELHRLSSPAAASQEFNESIAE